jgi:SAM-dependent methyltransferase
MGAWDGDDYQRRFDELAAQGVAVHGEADLVASLLPSDRSPELVSVLDAGCGTGRVAIELARRGVDVVGVDPDASMLAAARRAAPGLEWHEASMVGLDLRRRFDVVVMAGNVPLFTPPGTQADLVAGCARHLGVDGVLVAGFQLGRGYSVQDYDGHCAAAGLELVQRWSSWHHDPFDDTADYAVSVHRRAS